MYMHTYRDDIIENGLGHLMEFQIYQYMYTHVCIYIHMYAYIYTRTGHRVELNHSWFAFKLVVCIGADFQNITQQQS